MNGNDAHTNVLLYSKFSESCKAFMSLLERVPELKNNMNLICVDSQEIRDRIKNDEKLKVSKIPCVLRIYQSNGYVELFEGSRAFQILNVYINAQEEAKKALHIQQQQMQAQMQQQMQQMKHQMQQQMQAQMQQQMQAQQQQQQPSQPPQQPPPASPQTAATPIEDVLDDEKTTGINTFLHIPQERNMIPDRVIKKIENSKSSSLTNLAMQMQKEREQASSQPNPMNGHPRIP